MNIRRFWESDAEAVAGVVAATVQISNSRDYPPEYIEDLIQTHSAQVLLQRAKEGHMYVACDATVTGLLAQVQSHLSGAVKWRAFF